MGGEKKGCGELAKENWNTSAVIGLCSETGKENGGETNAKDSVKGGDAILFIRNERVEIVLPRATRKIR